MKELKDLGLLNNINTNDRHIIKPSNNFIEFRREELNNSIVNRFENQVIRYENKTAINMGEYNLTYKELNNRANQVAYSILCVNDNSTQTNSEEITCNVDSSKKMQSNFNEDKRNSFQINDSIALVFNHDIDMIVGIIGALKTGKAYVPLDPLYPEERLKYILNNTQCKNILTNRKNEELALKLIRGLNQDISIINIDDIDFTSPKENPHVNINPNQIAYVLYTSGSTGVPKGVMQSHRNVLHFISTYTNNLFISSNDKLTLLSSYSFDASVMDIYGALLNGATLLPFDMKKNENISNLIDWLITEKITIYHSIPTIYRYLVNTIRKENLFPHIRLIIMGGEAVYKNDVENYKKYFSDKCVFVNGLGPTESTVTLQYFINKETILYRENVPVGFPVLETQILIINEKNEEAVVNEIGEIYIVSNYFALGYLNNDNSTNEVFCTNPLTGIGRVYKSGDLGKLLVDGSIEFIGRKDFQVKIRGYRIEVGEIESILDRVTEINKSIICEKEGKNKEHYLVAYYTSKTGEKIDENHLKYILKEALPEYMVPSYFVQIDKMPLTVSGKIDRRAFPEPALEFNLKEYEAPRNKIEEILVKIWSEVLGIEQIGINDNFFDLGGHSLQATVLMSKIHMALNKEIPLKELFELPTIRELSEFIESLDENPYSKIEKVKTKEYYVSSSAQKRMFMIQQLNKDNITYNMPVVFELEGYINKDRIEEALKKLILRHDALRTYFENNGGEIVQRINNFYDFKLIYRKCDEEIKFIINNFIKPFDLEKVPLFRMELVKQQEKAYLLIDMHHIISDGMSMNILTKEFIALYNGENLEPLKLQYKDFAAWQNNFLKSEEMKKQEEYWINSFSDEVPILNLPYDYERPAIQSFEGDNLSFEVDEKTTQELRRISRETRTTMHMVLLSAFNILLSKYCGQEDIVVGIPIAGRPHSDLQNIMGMFVNTLSIRNRAEGDKKYIEFLKEVKENSLKAYENQSYQFETLTEKLYLRRDKSRNPLFDVMFNMVDIVNSESIKLDDILLKQYNNVNKVSKFDLTLSAIDNGDKLNLNIEYCTKLFNNETIQRLSNHYIRILDNIISNNKIKLYEIELLTDKESNQILYDFNDTKADYPKDITIHELFEEQVEKTPNNVAVVFEDKELSYRELNEKSNSLARVLRNKGVKADSIVGIMVERSIEMIIGIMGILKSGGAYLPIDPSYPKERIQYMLNDSKSEILLSLENSVDNIEFSGEVIDLANEELFNMDLNNISKTNIPSNLAYIIYTSGSTGMPKGVMIEHRNLIAYVYAFQDQFKLVDRDIVLQQATYCFDGFVDEFYPIILVGGKVAICSKYDILDSQKLEVVIDKYKISVISCSPLIINELNKCKNINFVRLFISGGDVLKRSYFNNLINNAMVFNTYGPTEATVCSCFYKCSNINIDNIPIGNPINNCKTYILDNNKKLVGIGIYGELFISGDGIARGYLNRPELTAEKFINNSFEAGTKMFKTGDIVRWLPNGDIQFIGRMDNQVKLRGFRIELEEIENKLLRHEHINEAAVMIKEDKANEKYICAYIVSEKDLDGLRLKGYLKETLPEYMVPAYFVKLGKMPLTANGKLDRTALPEPTLECILNEYEAPRNQIEKTLTKIWSEVLGVERIGINDSFFDLGGHSLKAMLLISKIHKVFDKKIELKEFFKCPTLKELSKLISIQEKNQYLNIEKIEYKEYYELSYLQKRLWIINQLNPKSTAYNLTGSIIINNNIEIHIVENVIKELINRHESLRTRFKIINGTPVQIIDKEVNIKLTTIDLSEYVDEKKQEEIRYIYLSLQQKVYNLEIGPLYDIKLIKVNYNKYILIFSMHHIISDGYSLDVILNKEIISLYNDFKNGKSSSLKPLKIQYKDFAYWQNNFIKDSEKSKYAQEYWKSIICKDITNFLNLPRTMNEDLLNKKDLGYRIVLSSRQKDILKNISKENNTSIYSIFVCILSILLCEMTGQEEVLLGSAAFGRDYDDLKDIVGYFVNTIILINKVNKNVTFKELLIDVNNNILKMLEYQTYPIEVVLDELKIAYPKPSVFLNVLNYSESDKEKIIDFNSYQIDNIQEAKFALELYVREYVNGIEILCNFKNFFKVEHIKLMLERFVNLVEEISMSSDMLIKEYGQRKSIDRL